MICICDAYGPNSINRCPIRGHGVLDMMSSASKFQPLKGHAMPTYTVTATLRSDEGLAPVTWSSNGTIADVMVSVGQLIQHDLQADGDHSPFRVKTETITITINHPEA